jgi:bla regulator protein blaR1
VPQILIQKSQEKTMKSSPGNVPKARFKRAISTAREIALAMLIVLGALTASWAQEPMTQSAVVPKWQTDAGGKMEFDVASIKPNKSGLLPSGPTPYSNIPLGPQDLYSPTGGLLSATNWRLLQYIIFAYKLTPDQVQSVRSQLPKWTTTEEFDIQARASGNPTKDQFRLMMQSALADRFNLAIHYEARQLSVFALVLDKPGKLGPQLQPHPEDSQCSTAPPAPDSLSPTVAGGFPESCGAISDVQPSAPGRFRAGARNMPMAMIANSLVVLGNLGSSGNIDRPILDKTGVAGKFDFVIEWTPELNGPRSPGATFQPDPTGPTFMEALKEQLGLKLDSQKGPVEVVVVDHVEQPSEN